MLLWGGRGWGVGDVGGDAGVDFGNNIGVGELCNVGLVKTGCRYAVCVDMELADESNLRGQTFSVRSVGRCF